MYYYKIIFNNEIIGIHTGYEIIPDEDYIEITEEEYLLIQQEFNEEEN